MNPKINKNYSSIIDELTVKNSKLLENLNILRNENKDYSDVISYSKEGNKLQWVNFVQEGGGTLGISLVGYTFALEYVGIRFLRLAGTSAGAINTLFLAAIGEKSDPKSPELFAMMMDDKRFNLRSFVDASNPIVRWLIYSLGKGSGLITNLLINYLVLLLLVAFPLPLLSFVGKEMSIVYILFLIVFIIISLFVCWLYIRFSKFDFGINPGKKFEEFLEIELKKFEIESQEDLDRKSTFEYHLVEVDSKSQSLNQTFQINHTQSSHVKTLLLDTANRDKELNRQSKNPNTASSGSLSKINCDYSFVTVDIKNECKVVLPQDADLYFEPKTISLINPAKYVRASMAIPLFFEPIKWSTSILTNSITGRTNWMTKKGLVQPNKSGVMIDGGSLSNFPINLFHQAHVTEPRIPIFGVRIVDEKPLDTKALESKMSFTEYCSMMINTLRSNEDNTFLSVNPFYKEFCIGHIKAYETDVNWLNFDLTKTQKMDLFIKGVEAGLEFLQNFDWQGKYKQARKNL